MGFPSLSTERERRSRSASRAGSASPRIGVAVRLSLSCAGFALAGLVAASAGLAHPPTAAAPRELVRLQGHLGTSAPDEKIVREVVLGALGKDKRFFASEWRRFALSDQPAIKLEQERPRFDVRGSRADLARLAAARPDQLVTILAEQRPGSADLFLIALDLCPPR